MSRRILAGLATLALFLAACQGEPIGPNNNPAGQPPGIGGPNPTHIGDVDLAAAIEADLTCLYQKAGLLPNESSSLGKFQTIKNALAADDLAAAQSALDNLIRFIELKWSQYKGSATVDCGGGNVISVEALKDRVILRLNVYVNTEGAVCEIPDGHPGTFCQADNDSAFVYFPPELFQQLTYVSVEENPAGVTKLQDTFDEYPNYVRILTAPEITFTGSDKPLVVVCFNAQVLQNPTSLLARLLLGKKHTDGSGVSVFKALPKPNYNDPALAVPLAQAELLCGQPPTTSAFGISSRTVLGRFVNKVLTTIMPRAVQAQFGIEEMAFGGVGGSPEEFSDFGAFDPGMAMGGVGGSPEEFAPPVAAPGASGAPALLPAEAPADAIIGKTSAGDSASTWATVTVKTGLGEPQAGAVVTFTLTDPSTDPWVDDPSAATFCNGLRTMAVGTDATGAASVTCLRFGTTVGFQNLKATLDPATIDPAACVIIPATGLCAADPTTVGVNYLVATVPGDPAQLSVATAPAGAAQAGKPLTTQPVVQLEDAGGNPVGPTPGRLVTASVSAGGALTGTTTATTDSEGLATFTNLGLGGVVGTEYTITFASAPLTSATAEVTVGGAGDASVLSVLPATTTAAAGGTIPTLTATVRDAYTNPVEGIGVSVAATGLTCVSGCPGSTNASGNAAFSTLSIGGLVGPHVVTFSATGTGLADATATVTLTPGAAAGIALVPPPAGGNYGSGLTPFTPVSPTPTVAVTDAYGNAVTGSGATVAWSLTGSDPNNGATVTPNGLTATWNLGDGGNGLSAFLGSVGSLNPVVFSASTATGGIVNACLPSGTQKKNDAGSYAGGQYTSRFSFIPVSNFRIRKVTLSMSVTGQSSGTGDYPATLEIWKSGVRQYTGIPVATPAGNVIQLDGNNGSAQNVAFNMTPDGGSGVVIGGQDLLFVMRITSPSNRTMQLWYNTKSTSANCSTSLLYKPGVIPPTSAQNLFKGHLIKLSN